MVASCLRRIWCSIQVFIVIIVYTNSYTYTYSCSHKCCWFYSCCMCYSGCNGLACPRGQLQGLSTFVGAVDILQLAVKLQVNLRG